MKESIGIILAVIGMIGLWVCGIGATISLVSWVLSLVGLPLITGAGTLFLKFAAGWIGCFCTTAVGALYW